jgi:hypothetical protein
VSVRLATPDAVRAACAPCVIPPPWSKPSSPARPSPAGRRRAARRSDAVAAHVTGDSPRVDGWYPDSVPPAGRHIRLRTAANRSQGGSTEDVTAITHPDNAELACQAAALLGLDVAGIDLIAPDISRPVQGSGGGICEVNRSPSLLAHLSAPGAPDVAGAYLDHVLAGAGDLRIPVLAVVGEAAADTVAAAVADRLEAAGFATGLACGATDAAGVPLAATRPRSPGMSLAADPGVAAVVVSVPPQPCSRSASPRPLRRRGGGRPDCRPIARRSTCCPASVPRPRRSARGTGRGDRPAGGAIHASARRPVTGRRGIEPRTPAR